MIQAAKSLCTRFREKPQVIQSWDVKGNSWQSQRGWECPVIIDNMMNLELLFGSDQTFRRLYILQCSRGTRRPHSARTLPSRRQLLPRD